MSTLLTYGNLKDLAYDLCGDDKDTPVYVPSASMDVFFNAALGRMVDESDCIERRMSIDLTADTGVYDLPSNCVKVLRVTFEGMAIRPVTKHYLRSIDQEWADTSGDPSLYYLDGLDGQIGLYPKPDTTAATTSLTSEDGALAAVDGYAVTSEDGFFAHRDFMEAEDGAYVGEGTGHLVVEYLASPYVLGTEGNAPEIPVWAYAGLLFGALERVFSANTELRSAEASALYGVMAKYITRRLIIRVNNKLPRVLYHRTIPGSSPYEQDGEEGRVSEYATAATD